MPGFDDRTVSRRRFLTGASVVAAGTLLGAALPQSALAADVPATGSWPYAVLDPEVIGANAWAPTGCTG